MRSGQITPRLRGWISPCVAAVRYHGNRLCRIGGCTAASFPRTSTRRCKPGQQALEAHSDSLPHPVPIREDDWLPHFINWLHANGALGINQHGARLALYEEESEGGNPANRGVVFTEASSLCVTSTSCL